jgi:hypothetical protein
LSARTSSPLMQAARDQQAFREGNSTQREW